MAQPTLEGIPVELQIAILFNISDIKNIRSIVHASPTWHQTYLLVRQDIIRSLTQQQYEHVDIAEAIAAVRSEGLYANRPPNKERIISLLDCRRRSCEIRKTITNKDRSPNEPTGIEECIGLLRLHSRAEFLLQDYCQTLPCPPWMDSGKWASAILPIQPSDNEKARFLRAFYRMQTWCNIFGTREDIPFPLKRTCDWSNEGWDFNGFQVEEVWSLFFGTMPPWEAEEFACLWVYCRNKYSQIFEEVADDLSWSGPRFKGIPPWELPGGECPELYPDSYDYDDRRENIVSIGPSFLYKILHQGSYEKCRDLVAANILPCQHPCSGLRIVDLAGLHAILRPDPPLIYPADKYLRDDIEDVLPTMDPLEQPNLGWILHWHGQDPVDTVLLEEMFIECFGNSVGWEWGYVLWDSDKFREWQAPTVEDI